ncbi:MAG: TrmH family RNA methyltransferase [Patescibacteria group bacterium]|nr:TrmH family RNA methyltransferase [Patescibacteria group bacterium]
MYFVVMILHLIAHDIRSAQNIGSLLRTCDSLGVEKLWVTGYSPAPSHPRVAKTALGAEDSVVCEQVTDVVGVIKGLRVLGFRIVGLELDERATELAAYRPTDKTALLLGNEVDGIPPSLRELCDDLVFMRQRGRKESMNVAVAAGIACYWILNVS